MRKFMLSFLFIGICTFAQTPVPATVPAYANYASGGISYNPGASPAIAGTVLYAKVLPGTSGTYSFSTIDALITSTRPFTVSTNVATGIAQKIFTIQGVGIFAATGAGISWTGRNTGWSYNGGFLTPIAINKNGLYVSPALRFIKSSVNQNSDYQVILSLMVGKGW
jgi:hypothetical protein